MSNLNSIIADTEVESVKERRERELLETNARHEAARQQIQITHPYAVTAKPENRTVYRMQMLQWLDEYCPDIKVSVYERSDSNPPDFGLVDTFHFADQQMALLFKMTWA